LHGEGKSKKEISRILKIRKQTIIGWLNKKEFADNRGWDKNRKRKHTNLEEKRICDIKRERIETKKYFVGSDYVQMDYGKKYPNDPLPSTWFIEESVRNNNLQTAKPKKKTKGGSKYLLYPEEAIKQLGTIQQSGDFIGKKYIDSKTEPINIFSTSYYSPFKLFQIERILASKSVYVYPVLTSLWKKFPVPDVYRIDNALTFRGSGRGKKFLGPFLKFLLNLNIIPLFGAPHKPWTNPHIEGHNKVFGDKVWGGNRFTSLEQIDEECKRFNQESLELFDFKYRPNLVFVKHKRYLTEKTKIEYAKLKTIESKKIYFIRFVENKDCKKNSFITVLNEKVIIPERYDHQFVFVECDIEKSKLNIYSEFEKKVSQIHQTKFKINL
jgi:hypothetical protein